MLNYDDAGSEIPPPKTTVAYEQIFRQMCLVNNITVLEVNLNNGKYKIGRHYPEKGINYTFIDIGYIQYYAYTTTDTWTVAAQLIINKFNVLAAKEVRQ